MLAYPAVFLILYWTATLTNIKKLFTSTEEGKYCCSFCMQN